MSPTPSANPLDAHLGFWLRFVSNHVSARFQKLLEAQGTTLTEWVALRTLFDKPHTTHAELIDALGMTKGAASKVISRLEEKGLALRQQAEAIERRHWNAQRRLEGLPVVIPYADRLSFPSAWMRTRRDHARFLNLIEVSAFLHQHQRQRQGGAIVAAVDDYAAAYALAADVLSETLSDLRKPLREAYERVRGLCERVPDGVTRREVREALGLPDSTVRNWLSDLVSLEYLEAEGGGMGRTTRYRLSGRGPQGGAVLGLLGPDELRRRLS